MNTNYLARYLMLTAMTVLAVAPLAVADQPAPARKPQNQVPEIHDIALQAEGTLRGALIDTQGKMMVDATVSVVQKGQLVATVQTDERGMFAVGGLRGGLHQIIAGGEVRTIRLWAEGTAPPIAKQGLLMVRQDQVLRGQQPGGHLPAWIEKGSLFSKDVVYGTLLLGAVGGATYWALDYNRSGS